MVVETHRDGKMTRLLLEFGGIKHREKSRLVAVIAGEMGCVELQRSSTLAFGAI